MPRHASRKHSESVESSEVSYDEKPAPTKKVQGKTKDKNEKKRSKIKVNEKQSKRDSGSETSEDEEGNAVTIEKKSSLPKSHNKEAKGKQIIMMKNEEINKSGSNDDFKESDPDIIETQTKAAITIQKLWRAKRARRFMGRIDYGHRDAMIFASSKRIFRHDISFRKLTVAFKFFVFNKPCSFLLAWIGLILFSVLEYVLEFFSPWWVVVTLRFAFTDSPGSVSPNQLALLYFCYSLLYLIMRVLRRSFEEDLQKRMHLALQRDVLKLCTQYPRFVTRDEVSRILRKTKIVPDSIVRYLPSLILNLLLFLASQAFLFQQSGVLGFISLGFLVVLVFLAFWQARFHRKHVLQQKGAFVMESHLWAFLRSRFAPESAQTLSEIYEKDQIPRRKYRQCVALVNNAQLVILLSTPLAVLFMGGFIQFEPYRLLSTALYFALSRLQFFLLTRAWIHLYDNTHDILSLSAFLHINRAALHVSEVIPNVGGRQVFVDNLQSQSEQLAERYWTPKQNTAFSQQLKCWVGLVHVVIGLGLMAAAVLVAMSPHAVFACPTVALKCELTPLTSLVNPNTPMPVIYSAQRFSLEAGCAIVELPDEVLNSCQSVLIDRVKPNITTPFTVRALYPTWKEGVETGLQVQFAFDYSTPGRRLLQIATPIGKIESISRSVYEVVAPSCICPPCPIPVVENISKPAIFTITSTVRDLRDSGVTPSHCMELLKPQGSAIVLTSNHVVSPGIYFFGGLTPGLLCLCLMFSSSQLWKPPAKANTKT